MIENGTTINTLSRMGSIPSVASLANKEGSLRFTIPAPQTARTEKLVNLPTFTLPKTEGEVQNKKLTPGEIRKLQPFVIPGFSSEKVRPLKPDADPKPRIQQREAPRDIFVANPQRVETASPTIQELPKNNAEIKPKQTNIDKVSSVAKVVETDTIQAERTLTAWKELNGTQKPEQAVNIKTKVEEIVREKHQEALSDPQVITFAKQLKRLIESVGAEKSEDLLKEHNIAISMEQVVRNVCNVMPETKIYSAAPRVDSRMVGSLLRAEGKDRKLPPKDDQPELICFVDDLSRIVNHETSEIVDEEARGRDIYTNKEKVTAVVNPIREEDDSNIQISEKTHEKVCIACLMMLVSKQLKLTVTREKQEENN